MGSIDPTASYKEKIHPFKVSFEFMKSLLKKKKSIQNYFCCFYNGLNVLVGLISEGNLIWNQSQPVESSKYKRSDSMLKMCML